MPQKFNESAKGTGGIKIEREGIRGATPWALNAPAFVLFLGAPFFWAVLGLAAALKMLLK